MSTFHEELAKLQHARSIGKTLDDVIRIEKISANHPTTIARQATKAKEQQTAADLDQAMAAHVHSKMHPGENEKQAFVRLVSEHDPAVSALYSRRKAAAALATKQRVDNGAGVHAQGIKKSLSDIHDAQQAEIVKASMAGETISEDEAMVRAVQAHPEIYSAIRTARIMTQRGMDAE
jgi:hypothetical protein